MHKLDQPLLDHASIMRDEMQPGITESNFYCKNVKKSAWPNAHGYVVSYSVYERNARGENPGFVPMDYITSGKNIDSFGVSVYQIQLKKAAINSPDICLDDLQEPWQLDDTLKQTARVMQENVEWLWSSTFQDETLKHCENHIVTKDVNQGITEAHKLLNDNGVRPAFSTVVDKTIVQFPPRVNFWGKRVYPYLNIAQTTGYKTIANPKYTKAAEQVIVWHPDIVEFVFPDVKNWSGELMYRNIPSAEHNPNGTLGFFRMLFSYAAKPERPDLGTVITVLPPGLKGWLWYWAWKLVGFKP